MRLADNEESTTQATGARRVLVIGPSWVGDAVMAQSLFRLLKQQDAGTRITVAAPSWSLELLERMPEVEGRILLPFGHGELKLAQRYAFARQLKGRFDAAIILPNSFKSALIPWFAGIPARTGWQGEWRNPLLTDCRRLDPAGYPLMVQRFAALALAGGEPLPDPVPVPRLHVDRGQAARTAKELGIATEGKVLALCPGAEFGDAKQWPVAHYAELVAIAVEAGWRIWVMGSGRERHTGDEICALGGSAAEGSIHNLAGQTSLGQAIDLLALATAVVTNDSGLMHVAAAVGTPLVALYGSTSPDFTPPLSDRVKCLSTDISCRPCFKRTCPLGHKRCLTEISPARVYQGLTDLVTH